MRLTLGNLLRRISPANHGRSRFFVAGFSLLLATVVALMIAVPVLVIVALVKLAWQ